MEQQQESKIRQCGQCETHLPPQCVFCPTCGYRVTQTNLVNTQVVQKQKAIHIFFSYAHEDKGLRDKLENHLSILKSRDLITTWHAQEVSAGQNYIEHISAQLNQAHIILLLISANFMASPYCYGTEMKRAIERHRCKEADVIPILLRPVHFYGAPFSHLTMLPKNGKFVSEWKNRDSAFRHIAEEIEYLIGNKQDNSSFTMSPGLSIPNPYYQASAGDTSILSPPSINDRSPSTNLRSTRPFGANGVQRRQAPPRRRVGFLGMGIFFLALLILFYFYRSHITLFFYTYRLLLTILFAGLLALFGIVSIIIKIVRGRYRRALQQREAARREEEARRRVETIRRQEEEARRRAEAYQEESQRQEEARSQNYYRIALHSYQIALEKNPFDALAYRGLGNAYLGIHSYRQAEVAFIQAIRLTPKQPACFVGLGDAHAGHELFSQALGAYEKALEIDPTYAAAYAHLYDFFIQRGQPQQARNIATRARHYGYEVEEETTK